jgi:hypothetical protein
MADAHQPAAEVAASDSGSIRVTGNRHIDELDRLF